MGGEELDHSTEGQNQTGGEPPIKKKRITIYTNVSNDSTWMYTLAKHEEKGCRGFKVQASKHPKGTAASCSVCGQIFFLWNKLLKVKIGRR